MSPADINYLRDALFIESEITWDSNKQLGKNIRIYSYKFYYFHYVAFLQIMLNVCVIYLHMYVIRHVHRFYIQ